MKTDNLKSRVARLVARQDLLMEQQIETRQKKKTLESLIEDIDTARSYIQEAARITQEALEFRISTIGTSMLQTIFDDPYELKVTFEPKGNRMDASITLKRGDEKVDPLSASGGGVVDIVAFSFRVSLWSISHPRPRNTMILDEPFRFVSKDLQPRLANALSEISERLKLQFIIVTHEDTLSMTADRVFMVDQAEGISSVQVIS